MVGDADFVTNLHVGVLGNRDLPCSAVAELAVPRRRLQAFATAGRRAVDVFALATAREARLVLGPRRVRAGDPGGGDGAPDGAPAAPRVTVRGTLGLAALLAVLVAYLVSTRPPEPGSADDAPPVARSLDRATRVEITAGAAVTAFDRSAGVWNDERVGDFVHTLESLRVVATIDDAPTDAALYGLGPDAPRLRVLAGTDVQLALEVGAMNPAETGVYVRRVGQPAVLLVGALLRWELEKLRRVALTTTPPDNQDRKRRSETMLAGLPFS